MSYPMACYASCASPRGRTTRRIRLALLLAGLTLLFACAGRGPALPAITAEPTLHRDVGRFVWFDLVTDDLTSAEHFYSGLFGWSFETVHRGKNAYSLIRQRGRPIAGAAYIEDVDDEDSGARWLGTLSVADVDLAISSVRKRGGAVIEEPIDVQGRGRMAVVSDPEGALFVLLRSENGDPPDSALAVGDWAWVELWTRDPDRAVDFYAPLTGWREASVEFRGQSQRILKAGDRPRAGLFAIPWAEVEANWLPYVLVEDLAGSVTRAVELGGTLLLRDGSAAILQDPTGAAFTIYSRRALSREVVDR
ncbi:MAG: VOC family protein [Deltaproteobacteria bacterium]|nr:VOC family protein [Deltaproteobacteria bacterium]